MPIGYKSGNSSMSLTNFKNASDTERLATSIRMCAESYDVHSFMKTRIPVISYLGHFCGEPVNWSDFLKNSVKGVIYSQDKYTLIDVIVEVDDYGSTHVLIFDKNFIFIGMGPIHLFEWHILPDCYYRTNGYHHYLYTEDSISRVVSPDKSSFNKITINDINAIRQDDNNSGEIFLISDYC